MENKINLIEKTENFVKSNKNVFIICSCNTSNTDFFSGAFFRFFSFIPGKWVNILVAVHVDNIFAFKRPL